MHFSLLRSTRTVNFTDVIFLSLPKSNSFLFSVYSGVAKVFKDLKEVLGEPKSPSSNLADKLTHVGRHGNNYSSRGWVGEEGKREFVIPPRTITPRVKGTCKHNSSQTHVSLAVSGTFASKETIDYFRITHNTLCLSPNSA